MKLTFLGTAAAEGYPALWCRCERCVAARERGGRNLRLRSSLLINDDLLIDPGPDTVAAAVRLGLDLAPVQAVLVTHPHSDHLEPTTLYWRRRGFVGTPLPLLHVYGGAATLARLVRADGRARRPDEYEAEFRAAGHTVAPFAHIALETGGAAVPDPRFAGGAGAASAVGGSSAGAAGATGGESTTSAGAAVPPAPETPPRQYDVWTLAASHAEPELEAMFFAIRQTSGPEVARASGGAGGAGGAAGPRDGLPVMLYATDTGPFSAATWAALDRLGAEGVRFGATAIDSTNGLGRDGTHHMNLAQMAAHQRELGRRGLLMRRARLLAHHFSHNGTPPHEELTTHLAERGLEPAYDGLVVRL